MIPSPLKRFYLMKTNALTVILVLLFIVGVHTALGKKIKVACIGNSITYGTGLKDRAHDSYPVQLQKLLGEDYEVGNFGKPSATLLRKGYLPYNQQAECAQALRYAGDIAVIHLGINDTDPRVWPNYRDDFVSDYLSLIDSLRSVNRQVRIIIARLTPISHRHRRFISGTKQWHDEIQKAIEQTARMAGAELIDFNEPFYARPDLFPDGLHPNPEGAGIMAKTVYSAITGDYGGLKLPVTYQDYMVIQRNQKIRINGTANTGDVIEVSFAGQCVKTRSDNQGKWEVFLNPVEQAGEDYELRINTKKDQRTFRHVAVGEVWLCSGQSNMAFMLKSASTAARDIPHANDPSLRLFDMQERWDRYAEWNQNVIDSVNALKYFKPTEWRTCTSENIAAFSAVAYYFGKMLRDSLKVPIGLICNAIGGSNTEAWIDRNTLETQFPALLNNWRTSDFIQDWVRKTADKNLKQATDPLSRHPYEPCYLYETGIMPLESYPLAGVIWYQGESNAHNFTTHEKLFKLLVDSWRRTWNNSNLPFYYVQLSSLSRPSWTWFRDSQRRLMLQRPHLGMAVSSDWGDSLNVHPTNKKPIGERLARWALHDCYGKKNVTPSGPLMSSISWMQDWIEVSFNFADSLTTSDGLPPRTFEIAEYDGIYYPAVCTIQKNRVKLSSPNVKHPKYVRYGWQPFTRANLINAEGLPASTFRWGIPSF